MEQSRAKFLKSLLLGATSVPILVEACSKSNESGGTSSGTSGSSTSGTGGTTPTGCYTSPTETAGPYPYDLSKNSAIFRTDITEGKTGVPLTLTLTIVNSNNNCAVISGARVDIWHCDKDGYYSEYSNTGYLGTQDNTGKTFLRGIQLSDANGQVTFKTIYPGWYSGRACHMHIEVFVNSVLKLTSQIAFPDSVTSTVYSSSLYSTHGQNSTTNAKDSILSDSYNSETVTITGDTTSGYAATLKVGVPL
ncbi:MAG: intradiol ring-cleavage dioxygenase [Bacteroidetes bacterium]|nr:intradiol ring-cleavage dioxygenase [Bacteroidota bacterium]